MNSSIREVSLYRNGAFITSIANCDLEAGKQTVEISGLTESLNPDTISVSVPAGLSDQKVSAETDQ